MALRLTRTSQQSLERTPDRHLRQRNYLLVTIYKTAIVWTQVGEFLRDNQNLSVAVHQVRSHEV
jgi:hypothetical protein